MIAPLLLTALLGAGQVPAQPAPAVADTAGPLDFAQLEGVIRERLSTCPLAGDQRVYALELSGRAARAIVKVYGISADQLAQQITDGRNRAQTPASSTSSLGSCEPQNQQCLLRLLSDRDEAIRELLGPPTSARPTAWPTVATVHCEGDTPPPPPPAPTVATPATTQP